MTIDKSLKVRRGLIRARSVMSRAERLEKLKEADRWKEGDSILGLPKVRVMKVALKKKKKAKKEEGEAAAGAAPADAKKAAGGAAGAKAKK
ncbi:MAG: hypothetical protein RIS70_459 [Planctomycetota bacterium]|jgi:small basic protein (TIGR04137 family)